MLFSMKFMVFLCKYIHVHLMELLWDPQGYTGSPRNPKRHSKYPKVVPRGTQGASKDHPRHPQLTTNHQKTTTNNQQLATNNRQLTTHNSQLTTTSQGIKVTISPTYKVTRIQGAIGAAECAEHLNKTPPAAAECAKHLHKLCQPAPGTALRSQKPGS